MRSPLDAYDSERAIRRLRGDVLALPGVAILASKARWQTLGGRRHRERWDLLRYSGPGWRGRACYLVMVWERGRPHRVEPFATKGEAAHHFREWGSRSWPAPFPPLLDALL